jgi:hypothetical protein
MNTQQNSTTTKDNKKSGSKPRSWRRSSSGNRLISGAGCSNVVAMSSPDYNGIIPMEQSRRSSMASSIADSVDYQQTNQDTILVSPKQRRASGPSSNSSSSKPVLQIDLPRSSMIPLPLRRQDSWGDLSVTDLY